MSDVIPVMRPRLPTSDRLLPYLQGMDAARWYTNHGPLAQAFQARLAQHFGVEAERVVTSANGTLGLMQALRAHRAPAGSACVMPSWTFVATAAAASAVGLTPCFVDVAPETWTISPAQAEAAATRRKVGAVIAVAPFGAPLDVEGWRAFERRTGIPVVIDAAAGFDTFGAGGVRSLEAAPTTMVSLHATKVFGVGEGAVLIAADLEIAHRIRLEGNFGFHGSRDAKVPGINAKISEYAAAVGLASFDGWTDTRRGWAELSNAHAETLRAAGLSAAPGFNDGWVSCYGLAMLPDETKLGPVGDALLRLGIETRAWWGAGCHAQPAYAGCPAEPLPVTDALARRVLGLPFWQGLGPEGFARVRAGLRTALDA